MQNIGVPPHIANAVTKRNQLIMDTTSEEDIDDGSTFSDTVTGSEPIQVVGRTWEIEKCRGEKEIVRGAGIMSTQPIIPPGDCFTYQSICPLKLYPPRGRRILGSMSGAYTMCRGNMGQHNFTVKVGKFNFILPEKI
eukprot:gene1313-biopygen1408